MTPNMNNLLSQARKLQAEMSRIQENLKNTEITGSAGNDAVVIKMSATGVLESVSISPTVIDPNDKEMLEDLVLTAFNDAKAKADKTSETAMSGVTGGLSIPGLF